MEAIEIMKTKNRTHHNKRRTVDRFAIWKVFARTTGFNQAEQTACALPVRLAWEALRSGTAEPGDIRTLTDVCVICIVATEKMEALVRQVCEDARLSISAIADRYTRCKRWGVDAAALRDIPPVLDLYEELLRNATGGQMEAWFKEVQRCKAMIYGGGEV